MKNKIILSLPKADAGLLQDAFHYATLITDRGESAFDGSSEYPRGILGQTQAYENLLIVMHRMADLEDGWIDIRTDWETPATFSQLKHNARVALVVIKVAAARLGIDARTGNAPKLN